MELNLYAFVGLIMLIGIVKKNAIMLIDFALEAQRTEGKAPLDAIYEGCLIRFRPIMMTTMAALMGTLPIALGFGAGAESRRPLGLAVVGGLLFSQLVTLYLTPVDYTYLESAVELLRRLTHRPPRTEPDAVPAPANVRLGSASRPSATRISRISLVQDCLRDTLHERRDTRGAPICMHRLVRGAPRWR